MSAFPPIHRHHEIRKIRSDLEQNSFPRLQMLLLVALTGGAGFVASYSLLHAGLTEMWLRYLASFGVAYLMFLFLLWLWLKTQAQDYVDVPDLSSVNYSGSPTNSCGTGHIQSGQGGDFAGGGANGSFAASNEEASVMTDASGTIGEALASSAEAEEFAIPLFILILFGVMAFSSLFMVYSAPVLFAELLVDGVLSASLYRRLRGLEVRHWLETALRRTATPFILTAIVVSASGWGMGLYAPQAHSIADVIAHAKRVK